jgi:hypothetical protein
VDWSTHGIKVILSKKKGKNEKVITYASKGLSLVQKKFHPMGGECYALVWYYAFKGIYISQTLHTLN